jgi:hypothetical protein
MGLLLDVATRSKRDQNTLSRVLVHVHVASKCRDANGLQFRDDFKDRESIFYCLQSLDGHNDPNSTQLVTFVLDKNTLALNMRHWLK